MNRDSRQAQTLLRVFEALGVPLIGAVDELMAWQQGGPNAGALAPEDAAKRFAALLAAAIGTGTQLAGRLAPQTQEEAEDARLRASTLAGAAIAQHYVLTGQMPNDAFNRRLSAAFDGLLSLADSFALLPEETPGAIDLVAARVEALTPFVQAVMRFPFGQDDGQIIRRLGEGLCDRASALADAFSSGADGSPELYAQRELSFLKGCAKLLARACEVEMDRMQQALSQGQIPQPPAPDVLMEHIWQRFEDGLDVLRAVIGFMAQPMPNTSLPPAHAKAPTQPQAQAAPKTADGKSNPMAFFVKKDGTSKEGEAA